MSGNAEARVLHLVPAATRPDAAAAGGEGADLVIDVDNAYLPLLQAPGHVAALIRPDHYAFGHVSSLDELPALITDLRRQLAGAGPAQTGGAPGRHAAGSAAATPGQT